MATNVIMPVLGMVQETGKILHWLKKVGDTVQQGEILFEVETDKAVQELEAPASGVLGQILAQEGEDVPVTQVVAIIQSQEEYRAAPQAKETGDPGQSQPLPRLLEPSHLQGSDSHETVTASPLAARMALENNLDLAQIKPQGGRVEKADILAYLAKHNAPEAPGENGDRVLASPKARRLARELNTNLSLLQGSGPQGAILAQDVEKSTAQASAVQPAPSSGLDKAGLQGAPALTAGPRPGASSRLWHLMAEHTTNSWTSAPHFYLHRNVVVSRLLDWHAHLQQSSQQKISITDLLVLVTARALLKHPGVNVCWQDGQINFLSEINISLAVALEDGLVVPVIHRADRLSASEIASERRELVARAQSGKLRPDDISGGTFTISNLGMFGVDSFNAVLNSPQAAILAVGRISEQVIPVAGVPVIRPLMNLSVSFDHRAIDGANGAKFLDTLARMIEEPLLAMN